MISPDGCLLLGAADLAGGSEAVGAIASATVDFGAEAVDIGAEAVDGIGSLVDTVGSWL
jgi:hypothetical protein